MAGWGEGSHKYTTICHACKQREFVPHIRVRYRTLPPEDQGEDSSDSDSEPKNANDAEASQKGESDTEDMKSPMLRSSPKPNTSPAKAGGTLLSFLHCCLRPLLL